jgi:threonine aldolase
MTEDLTERVPFQRKQQMQLASKMRFLAAQFVGLLEDGVWLRNARHANAMAQRLADGVRGIPGIELRQAVEANAIFAAMDPRDIEPLQRQWGFHVWDEQDNVVRWMTAFDTAESDVDEFIASLREVASARV